MIDLMLMSIFMGLATITGALGLVVMVGGAVAAMMLDDDDDD